MPRMTTPTFILELPIQDGDDVSRFLKPKFSFGTQVYNATLPSLSEYFSVSHYRISINGKIRHRAP